MNTTAHRPASPLCRLPRTLALACGWLLGLVIASAQTNIPTNARYEANFQGKNAVHEWTIDLRGDFNTLRFQVESPTAEVVVTLIPPGGGRPIRLVPVPNKGRVLTVVNVRGMVIEVTQDPAVKLPPGRYVIQVKPYKNAGPAGKYSIKIVDPVFPRDPTPAGGVAAQSEGKPTPGAPASTVDAQAELKALRERLKAVEDRLDALEKAR